MEYKKKDLLFVNNMDETEMSAEMLLFGEIGNQRREGVINGDDFGREMVFLSEVGFKNIRININSVGGGIIKGYSVISSMNIARRNGASIETHIVGVADSMAGMISSFGDKGKRHVANFGSGVVHEPLMQKEDGTLVSIDEMEEGDVKVEALNMRTSLIDLLSSSTGKGKDEVKRVMKEGKRLNATQMKSFGMVDKIVTLTNENNLDLKNKTAIELMVACAKIKVESNPKTMKEVNKMLNLSEDAAEGSAVKAILALQNKVKEQSTEMVNEVAKSTALKTVNDELVNKVKASDDAKAESYVDSLINSGKLKKESRESLVNQAQSNFEGFKTLTESLEVTFVDVTQQIDNSASGDKNEAMAKEYHTNHVAGTLQNLEKANPAKFEKMEAAYLASETNF